MIDSFRGEHRFLSNFYPAPVEFEGITYPTVEHAYQAAKTENPLWRVIILGCETAGEAKRCGRKVPLRKNWNRVRQAVMTNLIWQKFSKHEHLKQKLLATGVQPLIEGNAWGDTFWGVCRGEGAN